jgi:hypothetical protein
MLRNSHEFNNTPIFWQIGRAGAAPLFSLHLPRILFASQADEPRMPQVTVRGPFHELELRYQYRLNPMAIFHLLCRETLAPATAVSFRQVHKRTLGRCQSSQQPPQHLPRTGGEPTPCASSAQEPIAREVPKDQRIEVLCTRRAAADYELLNAVGPHLQPGPGALARLVPAVHTFGDEPL